MGQSDRFCMGMLEGGLVNWFLLIHCILPMVPRVSHCFSVMGR
jgi:hypothetical protein